MLEEFQGDDWLLGPGLDEHKNTASPTAPTRSQIPVAEAQPLSGPAQLRYSTRLVTEPTMVAAPR